MTVTPTTIRRANARAQRRIRHMVDAQCYGDPTDRRTRLYVQAERLLSRLKGEADEFALEVAADWRLVAMTGDYTAPVVLPDIPLAAYCEGDMRADWGLR